MAEPRAPIPPGLGRQEEGAPGYVQLYGQVLGPAQAPQRSGRWHPPMALGWEPPEIAQPAWHAPMVVPRPVEELADGEAELALLRAVYGNVMDAHKHPYAHHDHHGWVFHVEQYLRDRDAFFGPFSVYQAYRAVAQSELDANDGKLRGRLDPGDRAHKPRWREAQVPFYAWVRRAYENHAGAGVNIPAMIMLGTSQKLRDALKQVQLDYGQKFVQQGFNPRPIKLSGTYKLGTISDHAFGTAVDINPASNAQLTSKQWNTILKLTGKTLDKGTRKAKWSTAPQELHTAIKDINDAFVAKVDAVIQASKDKDSLEKVVAADPLLAQLKLSFVMDWKNGFFDLSWALVKELQEEGLIWGATFGDPDLHHFELP